jgi:hypothetical protein
MKTENARFLKTALEAYRDELDAQLSREWVEHRLERSTP